MSLGGSRDIKPFHTSTVEVTQPSPNLSFTASLLYHVQRMGSIVIPVVYCLMDQLHHMHHHFTIPPPKVRPFRDDPFWTVAEKSD